MKYGSLPEDSIKAEEFKDGLLLLQTITQRFFSEFQKALKVLVFKNEENGPLFIEVELKALGIKQSPLSRPP